MKAIQLSAFGGPEVMSISEIADPIPGANEEMMREVENWIETEMHRLDPDAYTSAKART